MFVPLSEQNFVSAIALLTSGGWCDPVADDFKLYSLPPTKEEVYVVARKPAFVCLSVCVQDYS